MLYFFRYDILYLLLGRYRMIVLDKIKYFNELFDELAYPDKYAGDDILESDLMSIDDYEKCIRVIKIEEYGRDKEDKRLKKFKKYDEEYNKKIEQVKQLIQTMKSNGVKSLKEYPLIIRKCIYWLAFLAYEEDIDIDIQEKVFLPLELDEGAFKIWEMTPRFDFLFKYCHQYYDTKIPDSRCSSSVRSRNKNILLDEQDYRELYSIISPHWLCKNREDLGLNQKIEILKKLLDHITSLSKKRVYPLIIRKAVYTLVYENYYLEQEVTGEEILRRLGLNRNVFTKWEMTPKKDFYYDSYKPIENPIKYMGQKILQYNFMVRSLVRGLEYTKFVDVFGGSGNVVLSMPYKKGCEYYYNDKDIFISNFFQVIHENKDWFLRELCSFIEKLKSTSGEDKKELIEKGKKSYKNRKRANEVDEGTLYARGVYKQCEEYKKTFIKKNNTPEEKVKAAVNFAYLYSASNYKGKISVSAANKKTLKDFLNCTYKYNMLAEKFQNIHCFCKDAIDIVNMKQFQNEDTLLYFDSPYIGTHGYNQSYFREDYIKLRDALKKYTGKWIFSCRAKVKVEKDKLDGEEYTDPEKERAILWLLEQYKDVGKYVVYLAENGYRHKLELYGTGLLEIMIFNFQASVPDIEVLWKIQGSKKSVQLQRQYRILEYKKFLSIMRENLS